MKNTTMNSSFIAICLLILATSFQSCKKSSTTEETEIPTESVFGIGAFISNPSGTYVQQNSALNAGEVSFIGKGANVTTVEPGFLAFIYRNGFYYAYKSNLNTLTKFSYTNQTLEIVRAIPFVLATGYRYGHYWVDDNTLLVYSMGGDYKIINVENMTITKEGNFGLPAKPGLTAAMVGFVHVKDNKIHVGYYYGDENYPAAVKSGKTNWATGTAYFAVYDYPAINNVVYSEDTRSTVPGNDRNGVLKTFVYNDDLYILTAPFEMVGQNWDKPHGIYRIKKGTSVVDPTYFLDLSSKLNGDPILGGGYAGNGKLLVRRIRMDLALTWNSYGFANVQEFHVVDMASGNMTKLDLPLAKSQPTAPNILADNGKVYFPMNTKDVDGNFYIYNYDSTTGSVNRGVKVNDVDGVNGLYKLK